MPRTIAEYSCINNPNIICPTRQRLTDNYRQSYADLDEDEIVENLTIRTAYADSPMSDERKLQMRLREHEIWARAIGCDQSTKDVCYPRVKMAENKTRSLGAFVFRFAKQLLE